MADNNYDFFNPDVAGVPIPDTNVTRPISPLKPNTGGELIGQGLGTALKDTGELVKDALHLEDYTNKEELSNRIHSSADPERDKFTALQQTHSRQLEGAMAAGTDADVTGAVAAAAGAAGAADPTAPNAPKGLGKLQKDVDKHKAIQEQDAQDEVYFRGRINMLAKQYRQAYPQYRDYIDHVFSKAGFGNPANEYLQSIQSYNRILSAASKGGEDKNVEKARNDLFEHKDIYDAYYGAGWTAKQASDLAAGGNPFQILAMTGKAASAKFSTDENYRIAATADKDQAQRTEMAIADNMSKRVGLRMQAPDMQEIIQRAAQPPGTVNPEQYVQDGYTLTKVINEMRAAQHEKDTQLDDEQRMDAFGRLQSTGRKVSPAAVVGGNYAGAIDRSLSDAVAMRDALVGKDPVQAHYMATAAQGKMDRGLYTLVNMGKLGDAAVMATNFKKTMPDWWNLYSQDFMTKMGLTDMDQATRGYAVAMSAGALEGKPMSSMFDAVTSHGLNNSTLNNFTWDQAIKGLKSSPPEAREGFVRSIYDPGLISKVGADTLTQRFAQMTDQDAVLAIKSTSPDAQKQAKDWIFTTGSEGIARPVLKTLNKLEAEQGKTVASQYKIHYNDATHSFGVDAFGMTNITNADLAKIAQSPSVAPTKSAVATVLNRVINPLNTVTAGYANILKGQTPEHINGMIHSEMRKAGYIGE